MTQEKEIKTRNPEISVEYAIHIHIYVYIYINQWTISFNENKKFI